MESRRLTRDGLTLQLGPVGTETVVQSVDDRHGWRTRWGTPSENRHDSVRHGTHRVDPQGCRLRLADAIITTSPPGV